MACSVLIPVSVLLVLTVSISILLITLYSTQPVRKSPCGGGPHGRLQPRTTRSPTSCCLRFVNIQHLPIPYFASTRKKARALHRQGLFSRVDVVFMQEAFSRILLDKKDILTQWSELDASLQLTCAEAALPPGYFTDSGLAAAAATGGAAMSSVKFIAFKGFSNGKASCSFANKGVAVFEVTSGDRSFRVANTHLQAVSAGNHVQLQQFSVAVQFAMAHGALILGGDMNVHEWSDLLAMTDVVLTFTNGKGAYVPHDNLPTCCKRKSKRYTYTTSLRLDHVWVLDTAAASCSPLTTRDDLTDGISDHACLETTLYFSAPGFPTVLGK
jgi:endonuclease/exonuclease/phosphatase family metal-dependent hydrolase